LQTDICLGYVLFKEVASSWEYVKEVGGQESRYVFVSLSACTYKLIFTIMQLG
jgi:hypothetical protein